MVGYLQVLLGGVTTLNLMGQATKDMCSAVDGRIKGHGQQGNHISVPLTWSVFVESAQRIKVEKVGKKKHLS